MIVCLCESISDRKIEETIEAGESSFEGLQRSLGVATQCGACSCEVKCLLKAAKQKQRQQHVARANELMEQNARVATI